MEAESDDDDDDDDDCKKGSMEEVCLDVTYKESAEICWLPISVNENNA